MGLAARRGSLWFRQVVFRSVVVAALPLILLVAGLWRRLLVRTTFIAITGSLGKTTAKEMLAAILATRARTFKTFGNKNGYFQAAANLLRVRPWHRYAVFEMGISQPGQMGPMACMVRPHVAIVLGLARVHTKGFHDRGEYAAEKAALLPHVEPGGLVLLNGDDPGLTEFAAPPGVRIVRFGLSPNLDYRADEISAVWPERLSARVHCGGRACRVETRLLGSHWMPSLLAAVAAAVELGGSLEAAAAVLGRLAPYPARLDPVTLPNGVVVIRDDYSCSANGFEAGLRFLREARANRRVLVFSDVSDAEMNARNRRKQLGREVGGWLDLLVLHDRDPKYCRRKVVEGGMQAERVWAFETIQETGTFLREHLRAGDLVLLTGRTTDHMARVFYAQFGVVECRRERCRKTMLCDGCWELGFKPEGEFLPPSAGVRV
jgi:UDP-N-acetylmuramoyl-tripeptide--D-alanyl-D-alanine ligase